MIEASAWARYDHWNEALASRMFGQDQADAPAYIDVSNEVLEACAREIGVDPRDAATSLAEAVRSTLHFEQGVRALNGHTRRFVAWRREHVADAGRRSKRLTEDPTPPPVVAILAVCVLAATKMGEDQNSAAHAYYPRLNQVLELDPGRAKSFATISQSPKPIGVA